LAYVVWLWLCFPLVAAVLRKAGDKARLVRLTLLLAIVTLTAIAYVGVKRACGWGQVPGSESDVVFNYPHKIIAAEDVISNFFTIFYTVLSNYSPPFLVSSNSLWRYGGEELIRLQSGYHASESHLAAMNHLFLWRFYAGVAATLFVAALAWVGTKAYRLRSRNWVILYVLMLMTLTGSPTHLLVKWRPMHALPYLSYHFYFGVMGLSLLIAYLAHLAHENLRNRRLAWSLIVIVWADIVYCALARPPLLSHLAGQLGMGAYPNPWQTLKQMMF